MKQKIEKDESLKEGYTPTGDKYVNRLQALENLSSRDLLKGKTIKRVTEDKHGITFKVPTWLYVDK